VSGERISFEILEINDTDVYRQGGSLFITATALTEDFVPLEVMKRDAWYGKGKEVRFRHGIPELDLSALIGHIHDVGVTNDTLKVVAEIWGYNDELKDLQPQVIAGELSISLGYKKTMDDAGNVVGYYIRELSLTPSPKCSPEMGCGIDSYLPATQSMLVQNEMSASEMLEKLEKTLGSQNRERGERIVELEATIEALDSRLSQSNDVIKQLKEKNESLEQQIVELGKEKEQAKTLSIRKEIIALQEITDEEAVKAEMEELASLSEDELTKTRDRITRALKIAQKKGRSPPVLAGERSVENEDDETPEEFALKHNPNLRELMKRNGMTHSPPGYGASEDAPPMIN